MNPGARGPSPSPFADTSRHPQPDAGMQVSRDLRYGVVPSANPYALHRDVQARDALGPQRNEEGHVSSRAFPQGPDSKQEPTLDFNSRRIAVRDTGSFIIRGCDVAWRAIFDSVSAFNFAATVIAYLTCIVLCWLSDERPARRAAVFCGTASTVSYVLLLVHAIKKIEDPLSLSQFVKCMRNLVPLLFCLICPLLITFERVLDFSIIAVYGGITAFQENFNDGPGARFTIPSLIAGVLFLGLPSASTYFVMVGKAGTMFFGAAVLLLVVIALVVFLCSLMHSRHRISQHDTLVMTVAVGSGLLLCLVLSDPRIGVKSSMVLKIVALFLDFSLLMTLTIRTFGPREGQNPRLIDDDNGSNSMPSSESREDPVAGTSVRFLQNEVQGASRGPSRQSRLTDSRSKRRKSKRKDKRTGLQAIGAWFARQWTSITFSDPPPSDDGSGNDGSSELDWSGDTSRFDLEKLGDRRPGTKLGRHPE